MGDALLPKTYTVDFLTKKRVTNNGVVPQYYAENSHEDIIPKEIFMQVQEELIRRSTGRISISGKKTNFSCSHSILTNCFLWGVWRDISQSSLEQPWQEIYCLEMHQQIGEHGPSLQFKDGV